MNTITASLLLLVVICLCGYVVTHGTGIIKIASFILGLMATLMTIYLHRQTRNKNLDTHN